MTPQTPATAALIPATLAETFPASSPLPLAGETVSRPSRLAGPFLRCANFIAAIREFVRGEIPEARSLQYAGHHHPIADLICKVCRADIHDKGETCSLQKDALCSTCAQFVPLDYYGKCMPAGEKWRYHEIVTSTIRPRIQHAATTQPPNGEMVMSG